MLSDSPLKITSSDTGLTKQYTDNEKIECIKLWMVTGNFTQTAAALSISIETVRKWKNTQWWADLVKEFKLESKLKLSDKLRSIAHKALAQVEDRLDKGDWFYDQKTGSMRRRPVSLRDVSKVTTDLLDRSLKLEDMPTDTEDTKQVLDKLDRLKVTFEKFAKQQKPVEVTDVVFIDVPQLVEVE